MLKLKKLRKKLEKLEKKYEIAGPIERMRIMKSAASVERRLEKLGG